MPLTPSEILIIGLSLGGAGLLFLAMLLIAVAQWIKVAAAKRWPVARGTVIESRVADAKDSDGSWDYRPVITYQYRVGGQVYTNNLLAFGSRVLTEGGRSGEKKALITVARYPVGCQVDIHYHPQRPDQSVLEPRSVVAKWIVLLGVGFLLIGVFVAILVLFVNAVSP